MIGGAAMALSSVSVVANSLRLKRRRIGDECEHDEPVETEEKMKKEFIVDGMTCNHCRMHVEHALNALDGVKAVVTLDPPVAAVEYSGPEVGLGSCRRPLRSGPGVYPAGAVTADAPAQAGRFFVPRRIFPANVRRKMRFSINFAVGSCKVC